MPEYVVVHTDGTIKQFYALDAADALTNGPDGKLYKRVEYVGPRGPDWTEFKVIVEPLTCGYRVIVRADGTQDAEAYASDLSVVLEMVLPHMRAIAAPDPLFDAYQMPSAPDGPPETG